MMIECYVKGAVNGVNGGSIDANPYEAETEAHTHWLTGHIAGGDAAKRRLQARRPKARRSASITGDRALADP